MDKLVDEAKKLGIDKLNKVADKYDPKHQFHQPFHWPGSGQQHIHPQPSHPQQQHPPQQQQQQQQHKPAPKMGQVQDKPEDPNKPLEKGQKGPPWELGPPRHGFGRQGPRATYPYPGERAPGPGKGNPKVKNVTYHKGMHFMHPKGHEHATMRDLGFSGVVDGQIIWTFGDTMMGTPQKGMICATDSVALGKLDDRTAVQDVLYPDSESIVGEWINCTPYEKEHGGLTQWAFGGTNVIEIGPGKGVVVYLRNHRPGGKSTILGAGIAYVTLDHNGIPSTTRPGGDKDMWDNTEPQYGDVGLAKHDGWLYLYGHGPAKSEDQLAVRTYLCRGPIKDIENVHAYEYWLGDEKRWTKQRLTLTGANGSIKIKQSHHIFDWMMVNQANPFWSNYFNKWMLISNMCFGFADIEVRTAEKLEGPWAKHGYIVTTKPDPEDPQEGFRYCATGHPEYDPTGKTVYVTWTHLPQIKGATVEWE